MNTGLRHVLRPGTGLGLCAGMLTGCQDIPLSPGGTVAYMLDAPLCSSVIPVEFLIDGVVTGSDTFRVNLPPDHTTSPVFHTTAGLHSLGARVVDGHVLPDTTVTTAPGDAFTLSLTFYCS